MPDATLLPGRCRLISDLSGAQWLHHEVSGEVKRLPPSDDGAWELEEDEDGFQFCCNDGDREIWAADYLGVKVYTSAEGNMFLQLDILGASPLVWDHFETKHDVLNVGIRAPGDVDGIQVRISRFWLPQRMQHFWWPTHEFILRRVLVPHINSKKRKAGDQFDQRKKAWVNLSARSGCPCLRRARPQKGRHSANFPGEPRRCLAKTAVCTWHLVAILAQLAYRHPRAGGCEAAGSAETARRLLAALCARAALTSLTLRVASDIVFDSSGLRCDDENPRLVTLPVQDMTVDVRGLLKLRLTRRRQRDEAGLQNVGAAFSSEFPLDQVPLPNLLGALIDEELAMHLDVIYSIASGVEQTLASEWDKVMRGQIPEGDPLHLRRPGGSDLYDYEMSNLNAQRLRVTRPHVEDAQFASISTDAARIGFKGRLNTAIVLDDNFGSWAPPTVGRIDSPI